MDDSNVGAVGAGRASRVSNDVLTAMRTRAERVLAVENSGEFGTASGLRTWAEDVLVLLDEIDTMQRGLRRLAVPASPANGLEAVLLQDEVAEIAMRSLSGDVEWPHPAGYVLDDRGDGLHWLRCCDCGREWAEDDEGTLAKGSSLCGA